MRLIDSAAEKLPEVTVAKPPDLQVEALRKSYVDRQPVLKDISFEISRGQAVSLIGANGSGKSTLMRCCLRLIEPDGGAIWMLGEQVTRLQNEALRRVRTQVGFIFQRHNLVPRLKVITNVIHGAQSRLSGPRVWLDVLARDETRWEAMRCLEMVGLAQLAEQRVDQLSGGQSQRVAIARALMQRPKIMLADEPVASLDPVAGEEVMGLFLGLIRKEGLTLFFSSHHLEHAIRYSDRIIGLREGHLQLDTISSPVDIDKLRRIYD